MAGPLGMVRLHDTRDWAQRQGECHDLHAHRARFLKDAWWQMPCRLDLARPPRFVPEARLRDRFLIWVEATWTTQQIPWAILFFAVRIAVAGIAGTFAAVFAFVTHAFSRVACHMTSFGCPAGAGAPRSGSGRWCWEVCS